MTMKNSKIIVLLLISIFYPKAFGQIQSIDKSSIINVAPQTEIIKFSDIFKNYKIYRLKSDNKHFLRTVSRVIPIDDKFVINATSDNSRVHLFDKNGNYLANVGLVGRGPSEYLSVRSLKVYPSQKLIEILDYNKNSILRYSTDDGRYLDVLKINENINTDDFEKIDNNYYILFEKVPTSQTNQSTNKVKVYSVSENKEVKGFLPVDPILSKYLFFGELTNLYQFDNSICFFTSFTDTIFSISRQQKTVKYIFNLGKYLIKKNILYNNYEKVFDLGEKCIESLCIWDINCLLETQSVVFFRFRYGKDFYYSFFNKSNNKTINSNRFNDDLILNKIGISTEMINPVGKGDNSLYFRLEAPFFLKALDNLKKSLSQQDWQKYCDTHKQVIELYNSIDINENDLIVEFFLKD
jgi:hypothetical protein